MKYTGNLLAKMQLKPDKCVTQQNTLLIQEMGNITKSSRIIFNYMNNKRLNIVYK